MGSYCKLLGKLTNKYMYVYVYIYIYIYINIKRFIGEYGLGTALKYFSFKYLLKDLSNLKKDLPKIV